MNTQLMIKKYSLLLLVFLSVFSCTSSAQKETINNIVVKKVAMVKESPAIELGNAKISAYLPTLEGKKVAFVGNHTSLIGNTHLVDSLLKLKVNIKKVFSPEHGFRGTADAGEMVNNEIDDKTGLPIISLYGSNKKPNAEQLAGIEVIVFDIQDVGIRFYTYISTLHYVMEAAAEQNIPVIVLDRPNPNGHYIDGPVLEKAQRSFVGLHPVPIVHGMTIGEYAKMINGEKWLKNGVQCNLTIISCENYNHDLEYELSVPPSPNLPNMNSIYLYPSLCFFEGTPISVGRGTSYPFQQIGHPELSKFDYFFTPRPGKGAKNPKLKGKKCFGIDFTKPEKIKVRNWAKLDLTYLIEFYNLYPEKKKYFTNFFNLLAGNSSLKAAIKAGDSATEIRATWKTGLEEYKIMREPYLIYD